ncbi:MAG TPA: hypothetical protein VFM21_11855, partial [Terriglobia bacterium]|nr:hypothetical protein [Terriglobia bacterium]
MQIWLASLAFYFPIFWLSTTLIWCLPALARSVLPGWRLEGFSITAFGMSAASVPETAAARGWLARPAFSLFIDALFVLIAAAILARFGNRIRVLSGLAMAVLADVALANSWRCVFEFSRLSTDAVIGSLVFFAVMCFGLRRMLSGWPEADFLRRLAQLAGGFVLLPLFPWLWFSWTRGPELWIFALALMAPAALASVVAALLPAARAVEPQRMSWRVPVLGAAALAMLIAGVSVGEARMARARAEAAREILAAYPALPP